MEWLEDRTASLRARASAVGTIVVLFLLSSLAPAVWPKPASAYEGDHYVWTYYLALHVGFTKRQAYQIASGAYALDFDPNLSPMDATTPDILFGANHALFGLFGERHPELAHKWRDFHAFADEELLKSGLLNDMCNWSGQLENPQHECLGTIMRPVQTQGGNVMCSDKIMSDVAKSREQRKWNLFGVANADGNPGVLVHFVQDYYAHYEWDNYRGHVIASHLPDHLGYSRSKAECATRDTLGVLQDFQGMLSSFHASGTDTLVPQTARPPDTARINHVLAELMLANPTMGSWNPLPSWQRGFRLEAPSNLSVGGKNAAIPSPGRSATVVNAAILEDEAAGRLPKWPMKVGTFDLMPPTYFPYRYDQHGRMSSSVMAPQVEQIRLVFQQPEIRVTPNGKDSVKLHLKMSYTIQGQAEMWDKDILNKYLTPIPVIERDQTSDESSPTERQYRREDGTYTIEREVEKTQGGSGATGGARFANGCGPPSSATPATEAERMAVQAMKALGRGTSVVPCEAGPSNLNWTVSIQLYGYSPVEKTFALLSPPEGAAPPTR